jgi:hypothetical protein
MPEITGFFFAAVVIAWLYRRPDAARIWRRLRKAGKQEGREMWRCCAVKESAAI